MDSCLWLPLFFDCKFYRTVLFYGLGCDNSN
jgi:hypothetical protein